MKIVYVSLLFRVIGKSVDNDDASIKKMIIFGQICLPSLLPFYCCYCIVCYRTVQQNINITRKTSSFFLYFPAITEANTMLLIAMNAHKIRYIFFSFLLVWTFQITVLRLFTSYLFLMLIFHIQPNEPICNDLGLPGRWFRNAHLMYFIWKRMLTTCLLCRPATGLNDAHNSSNINPRMPIIPVEVSKHRLIFWPSAANWEWCICHWIIHCISVFIWKFIRFWFELRSHFFNTIFRTVLKNAPKHSNYSINWITAFILHIHSISNQTKSMIKDNMIYRLPIIRIWF